jgi:cytochrome c556
MLRTSTCLLILVTLAACGNSAKRSEAPTLASIQELMLTQIDPAADVLWESVATISNAAGVEDRQPRTDAQWAAVRKGALALIQGADALTLPGRAVAPAGSKTEGEEAGVESVPDMQKAIDADHPRFVAMAHALRITGEKALAAIDRRDPEGLFDVGGEIDEACEHCHRTIWYPHSP